MNNQILQLWPTPVYLAQTNLITNEIIENVKSQSYVRTSNNLNDITIDKKILLKTEFKNLKENIDEHFYNYVYNILNINTNNKFIMTNSWILKNSSNETTHARTHQNCIFSGVIYVVAEENQGVLKIHKDYDQIFDNSIKPDFSQRNIYNSDEWNITPQKSLLIIFPSKLKHSITENKSNKTRFSISFNYFLTGVVGDSPVIRLNLNCS
jgi:uncharacterized protein (TIGR02466 family)